MWQVKDKESVLSVSSVKSVLRLFYNTMEHTSLHTSLAASKSLTHLRPRGLNNLRGNSTVVAATSPQSTVSSLAQGNHDFLSLVNAMSENPRSLKELARISIYKSLNRQIAPRVDQLPLPHIVKKYLLTLDS